MVPAHAYIYLALLVGIVPTAALAVLGALTLRSVRGVIVGTVVGAVAAVVPIVPALLLLTTEAVGPSRLALFMLVLRVLSIGLGFMLYRSLVPSTRGHRILGGRELPLLWLLVPALALVFLVPGEVRIALEMPLFSLVSWLTP